ncbi:MAG: TolC family protein [Steroidobacteraceae bacterium]
MNIPTMRIATPWRGRRRRAAVIGLFGALALAGCSTFSQDGGFDAVARTAHERLGKEVRWARTPEEQAIIDRQVVQLLQRPLSVDDAVQIALLNNGALQGSFQELGISEADLVQSGRLPNPRFTLRRSSADGQYDIEETFSMNVLSLLTVPYAHDIEKRRFAEAQSAAVLEVVQLADRTREAYFMALAAREFTHYRQQVQAAAEAGAELARRMRAAGNWNRLDEAREQGFYLDAALELTRAQLAENVARDNLTQLLGLAGDASKFQLAERLPDLPPRVEDLPNVELTALQTRIDLQMMRTRIDALARNLHLTKATRFVNVLDVGPTRVRQGARSAPFESGYEVSLEVPIFDTGAAGVRKAEAIYAQAVERFAQAAIEARAEVRKAYARYRATHEMASRERDEVLPLRKSIADEDLLRFDAAQISVFDLLADARAESSGVNEYIQSVRDFWIAKSALDTALLGNPAHW